MGHEHSVHDSDARFSIDPVTRMIKNESKKKLSLIQGDHNSEIFSFTCPRYIEFHDMSQCDMVEVHYFNYDLQTNKFNSGIYEADDLQVGEDENSVVFSWKISGNGTQNQGRLEFLIRFKCEKDGIVTYAWNTAFFTETNIGKGSNADSLFETEYVDIIEQWKSSVLQGFEDEFNDWKEKIETQVAVDISQWKKEASEEVDDHFNAHSAEWNQKLAVERERINQFTRLPEGSTTGDAELMDIRIGADGKVYKSAGAAVRLQIEEITDRENMLFEVPYNYARDVLSRNPVMYNADKPTVYVNGSIVEYKTTYVELTKWLAFPLADLVDDGEYRISVDVTNISGTILGVYIRSHTTDTESGFIRATFSNADGVYKFHGNVLNDGYLLFLLQDNTTKFTATISILHTDGTTILKNGVITERTLNEGLQEKVGYITPSNQFKTSLFIGNESGNKNEEPIDYIEAQTNEGCFNTAVGVKAMCDNTTGDHCSAFGFQAMQMNTTGDANTGLGEDALYCNTTGSDNTAVGAHAAQNTNGSGNVFVGSMCGYGNTSGFYNTIIGSSAGKLYPNTGSRNVIIGHGADLDIGGRNNCIIIGNGATSTKDGQVVLGNNTDTIETIMHGDIVVRGTDGIKRRLVFESSGVCRWIEQSE